MNTTNTRIFDKRQFSLSLQSEQESCKMSKVSLLFLAICLAALVTSGIIDLLIDS